MNREDFPDAVRAEELTESAIRSAAVLPREMQFRIFGELDSTNTYLKRVLNDTPDLPAGTVVIADRQTKGRGRLGRQFYSPSGSGLYMSLLLRPTDRATGAVAITTFAGVAVARAIDRMLGIGCNIKWVNDVYVGGKKVSGILTEGNADLSMGGFSYVILGIGVNVKKAAFPPELSDIATSLEAVSEKKISRAELAAGILFELTPLLTNGRVPEGYMDEYRRRNLVPGREIRVLKGGEEFLAFAEGITDDGSLTVRKPDGTRVVLSAGEVSLGGFHRKDHSL